MGVRFLCPNGHKLNVKAELAGKRAICPECGAKLIVPGESTSGAAAAEPTTSAPLGPSAPSQPATESSQSPPVAVPAEDVWYVRPSSGGQFGPATTEVARGWLVEGRIAKDSWLWRTGWPEWKLGKEAISLLQSDRPTSSAESPPVEKRSPSAAAAAEPSDVSPPSTAETAAGNRPRRSKRHGRKERARQLTLALGAVVLVLSVLLVFVLWK